MATSSAVVDDVDDIVLDDVGLQAMVRRLVTDLQPPAGRRRGAVRLTSHVDDGPTGGVGQALLNATERRIARAYATSLNATRAG